MRRSIRFLLALGLLAATAAGAQTIAPIAGEHADFTRVVLRLPAGTGWVLSPEGRQRRITLAAPEARFTLDAVFLRIPRTRLAEVSAEGPVLTLDLACDCPIRAYEDRPGLVILDIGDPPAAADAPAIPPLPPAPRRPPPLDPLAAARLAGEALARARAPAETGPEPAPADDPRLATLAEDLGRSVASALGQGILDPAADVTVAEGGLLAATPQPDLPQNMRIATVLDRDDPAARLAATPPAACQGSEILDRLLGPTVEDWSEAHGRLTRALYGEFDQPDPQARLDLIGLYLASGFGAEARALLANGPEPVAGRDFALGLADVFDDRASNSRMRLAQAIGCGGTTAVMAVMAGADAAAVRLQADRVALTYTTLAPRLRGLTGAQLVARLADSGALDAARIVADSFGHSEWAAPADLALVAARLDRARGLPGDAAARLAAEGGRDSETVQTRLDLALQTDAPLDPETLAGAEALAATERGATAGPELMAAVVRLHARSGASPDAFAALDRLESWMTATGENRRLLGELRDEVWQKLAETGSDFGIVEAVLAREDWRSADLAAETRYALARRLLDLGLATPVLDLVGGLQTPQARVLLARARLETGDAAGAVALLGDDPAEDARRARAAALDRLGDHAAAAAEFAALGIADAEARAALLAGDWRRFESLTGTGGNAPALAPPLAPLLGRAPGHAEIAREQAAQDPAPATGDAPAPAPQAAAPRDAPGEPVGPEAGPTPPANPDGAALPRPPAAEGAAADGGLPLAALPPADPAATAAGPALAPAPGADPGAAFDRLGLVRRSSTLLAESERLRDALGPLMAAQN